MGKVLQIASSHGGRFFIAGDVSGHFGALQCFMDESGFSPSRDRLILNGNFIGLSARSREARAWLEKPWVIALAGRNEIQLVCALQGAPIPSLCTQWVTMISSKERELLLKSLSDLPAALEVNYGERGIAVVAPAALVEGSTWGNTRQEMISGELSRQGSLSARLEGLKAMRLVPGSTEYRTPDITLSVSSFVTELSDRKLAVSGNRYFLLGSSQADQGDQYINNSVIAIGELTQLMLRTDEELPWIIQLSTKRKSLVRMT